jgi:hypothetical protein
MVLKLEQGSAPPPITMIDDGGHAGSERIGASRKQGVRTREALRPGEAAESHVVALSKPLTETNQARPTVETFTLTFLTVATITILAILAAVLLANMWSTPTANQQTVFESVVWLYRVGFGTMIVLLGKGIFFAEGAGRKLAEAIRIISLL